MRDILLEGVIRKMWIGEAHHYREHLLRLDAESRECRFGSAVSDDFLARYADLSLGIDDCHPWLLRKRHDARRRRTPQDRQPACRRSGGRLQHRAALAKPRCWLGPA